MSIGTVIAPNSASGLPVVKYRQPHEVEMDRKDSLKAVIRQLKIDVIIVEGIHERIKALR